MRAISPGRPARSLTIECVHGRTYDSISRALEKCQISGLQRASERGSPTWLGDARNRGEVRVSLHIGRSAFDDVVPPNRPVRRRRTLAKSAGLTRQAVGISGAEAGRADRPGLPAAEGGNAVPEVREGVGRDQHRRARDRRLLRAPVQQPGAGQGRNWRGQLPGPLARRQNPPVSVRGKRRPECRVRFIHGNSDQEIRRLEVAAECPASPQSAAGHPPSIRSLLLVHVVKPNAHRNRHQSRNRKDDLDAGDRRDEWRTGELHERKKLDRQRSIAKSVRENCH